MSIPVITISREYGSGGRAIGEKLAKELGIPFYNKELILMAAKESGLSEEYIKKAEQQKSTSFLLLLTGIFVIIVHAALQLHISPLLFGSRAVLKGAVCPRRRFDKFLFRVAPISPPPESRQQGAAFQRLNS